MGKNPQILIEAPKQPVREYQWCQHTHVCLFMHVYFVYEACVGVCVRSMIWEVVPTYPKARFEGWQNTATVFHQI